MSGMFPQGTEQAEKSRQDTEFFSFPAEAGEAPVCGLSLKAAGALRPGENEPERKSFFESLGLSYGNVISLSQVHSRDVFLAEPCAGSWTLSRLSSGDRLSSAAHSSSGGIGTSRDTDASCGTSSYASRNASGCGERDAAGRILGDGVLSLSAGAIPCVTVADCMPIWLFEPRSGCFGVLHSGWKGTGIVAEAILAAKRRWSCDPASFFVIFGPHIRQCCYTVDSERAAYFRERFCADCVSPVSSAQDTTPNPKAEAEAERWPYRLSLAAANLSLCLSLGIPRSHIVNTGLCTACSEEYGSNRRESASRKNEPHGLSASENTGTQSTKTPFTSMAAFIYWRG